MNEKNERKTIKNLELRLYELFGIRIFRKLVLKVEGFRHRNDNSRNINYHIHGRGISSIKSFNGYLLYNTVCHCISIFFVAVYFTMTWIFEVKYIYLDVSMYIMFVLNLYCIMLQRYTYVKIHELEEKLVNVKNKRVADKIERVIPLIKHREYDELKRDFLLIERIQESIQNGTECIVKECDVASLNNISECVKDILGITSYEKRSNDSRLRLETAMLRIPKQSLVINKVTRRAAKLQDFFHIEKRSNVLFGFSIITETDNCENAYRSLIRYMSRDSVEFIFDVLFGAYNKALLSLRKTHL